MSSYHMLAIAVNILVCAYAVTVACRFTEMRDHRWLVRGWGVVSAGFFAFALLCQLKQGHRMLPDVRIVWAIFYTACAFTDFFAFRVVYHAALSGRRRLPLEQRKTKGERQDHAIHPG